MDTIGLSRWSSDPLIRWSAGPLVRWADPLIRGRWSADPLVRWSADPLVRWSADPLIRWSADQQRPQVRRSADPLGLADGWRIMSVKNITGYKELSPGFPALSTMQVHSYLPGTVLSSASHFGRRYRRRTWNHDEKSTEGNGSNSSSSQLRLVNICQYYTTQLH